MPDRSSRSSAARQPAVVMMAGAKGEPGVDSKLVAAGSGAWSRGVDEEAPGADRLEPAWLIVIQSSRRYARCQGRPGGERGERVRSSFDGWSAK